MSGWIRPQRRSNGILAFDLLIFDANVCLLFILLAVLMYITLKLRVVIDYSIGPWCILGPDFFRRRIDLREGAINQYIDGVNINLVCI